MGLKKVTQKQFDGYRRAKHSDFGMSANDAYNKAKYQITNEEFKAIAKAEHAIRGTIGPDLTLAQLNKYLKENAS